MNLRTNSLLSLMGSLAPALTALVFVPGTLRGLGNEAFGVLSLMLALIGYFSVFDAGMSRALTYRMAQLWTAAETGATASGVARSAATATAIAGVLGSGLAITLVTAGLGAVVVYAGAGPLVERTLHLPAALQADAVRAMQIVAGGTVFVTISSATRGALEGINRFAIANVNKALTGFGTFFVPWFVTRQGIDAPLTRVAVILVVLRLLISLMELVQLLRITRLPPLQLRPNRTDTAALLRYGGWILVSNVLSPLMVYGDRFVVGAVLGAAPLPYYAIPQEGLQRLLIIPSALCSALMPRLTVATDAERRSLVGRFDRLTHLSMGGLAIVVALIAYPFFSWWISEAFAREAIVPTLIMLIGFWLNANAMVKFVALHAMGHTRVTALIHIVEFVVYFAVLWVLSQRFGIAGAATAWTLRMSVDNFVLGAVLRRRMADVTPSPRPSR